MPDYSAATNDSGGRARLNITVNPTSNGASWSASVVDNNGSLGGYSDNDGSLTITLAGQTVVNDTGRNYDFGSGVYASPFFPRSYPGGSIGGLSAGTTYTVVGTFSGVGTGTVVGTASINSTFTTSSPPAPTTPTWAVNSGELRPNATRGVAYSSTVTAGPVTSYTNVSQSENTRGLSATANVISGTPTSVGTVEFTIRANNSTATNSRTFSVTIDPAIPSFTDTTLATAIRDASYSDAVVADDTSNTGYSSTVIIPGLTFNSDGTITGTPTTLGTYNFVVTATNAIGSTNANVSLTVARPVPDFEESEVLSSATWGVAYTDGVEATDATNYSVNSGTFPPGLTLNPSTGEITGVPTAVGSFTFVIRASNETGGVNTSSQTINVISPVRVNTVTGPTGSFVTGAVNVNTATGPTGSFVPGVVRIWNGTTWAPARLT